MKRVEIIIPHRALDDLNTLLKDMHIGGMSVARIEGRGRVKPAPISTGRGVTQFTPEFIPRTKVEIVVKDELVEDIIKAILDKIGGDPNIGGKIFVSEVVTAADLVTKKRNEEAI